MALENSFSINFFQPHKYDFRFKKIRDGPHFHRLDKIFIIETGSFDNGVYSVFTELVENGLI